MSKGSFQTLLSQGAALGEVIAVDRFFVRVKGLYNAGLQNQVLFENGDRGMVWELNGEEAVVLNFTSESIPIGTVAALESAGLAAAVGPALVGRVISVLGQPLDGKGPLPLPERAAVFKTAAPIIERAAADTPVITGVTVVDTLFPLVYGQRVAVIGDARTGKSTFLMQLSAINSPHQVYVYVLINKRKADVQNLLRQLASTGAIARSVVIVADIFESLAQAYLAPYVGCAIAEYLRDQGNDVIIVYDDLTNHAKIYREIALLGHASAGRDSYPGDIFYAHSSLLERAGCFTGATKTITALAVVVTPDDDITGYLATNVMSITDGQLIFTRENFQKGQRPAIDTGLSVSRIGGKARTPEGQAVVRVVLKKLADYAQALEFSHFEAGQSATSRVDLELGQRITALFQQRPEESYSLLQQQLLLEVALRAPADQTLHIEILKRAIVDMANKSELTTSQYGKHLTKLLATKGLTS